MRCLTLHPLNQSLFNARSFLAPQNETHRSVLQLMKFFKFANVEFGQNLGAIAVLKMGCNYRLVHFCSVHMSLLIFKFQSIISHLSIFLCMSFLSVHRLCFMFRLSFRYHNVLCFIGRFDLSLFYWIWHEKVDHLPECMNVLVAQYYSFYAESYTVHICSMSCTTSLTTWMLRESISTTFWSLIFLAWVLFGSRKFNMFLEWHYIDMSKNKNTCTYVRFRRSYKCKQILNLSVWA